jgi:hypothetical protein
VYLSFSWCDSFYLVYSAVPVDAPDCGYPREGVFHGGGVGIACIEKTEVEVVRSAFDFDQGCSGKNARNRFEGLAERRRRCCDRRCDDRRRNLSSDREVGAPENRDPCEGEDDRRQISRGDRYPASPGGPEGYRTEAEPVQRDRSSRIGGGERCRAFTVPRVKRFSEVKWSARDQPRRRYDVPVDSARRRKIEGAPPDDLGRTAPSEEPLEGERGYRTIDLEAWWGPGYQDHRSKTGEIPEAVFTGGDRNGGIHQRLQSAPGYTGDSGESPALSKKGAKEVRDSSGPGRAGGAAGVLRTFRGRPTV